MVILAALFIALIFLGGSAFAGALGLGGNTQAVDLVGLDPADVSTKCQNIIAANIDSDFSLACALISADAETGIITTGVVGNVIQKTNSFYNRHKGNGVIGEPNSDGYWTGKIYFASSSDRDIRIYTSLEQSVQDFMDLMSDPLYANARAAAVNNDILGYINALISDGYAEDPNYKNTLTARATALGYLA